MNDLHIPNQYGYKKGHSTESILLKITNDILIASDKKTATVLLLLDLSAAFDTVDVNVLLNILFEEIGIRGSALLWFKSFLLNRSMRDCLRDPSLDQCCLIYTYGQFINWWRTMVLISKALLMIISYMFLSLRHSSIITLLKKSMTRYRN